MSHRTDVSRYLCHFGSNMKSESMGITKKMESFKFYIYNSSYFRSRPSFAESSATPC